LHGVSVLVIGNWLGLHSSKTDDKHVNANGGGFSIPFPTRPAQKPVSWNQIESINKKDSKNDVDNFDNFSILKANKTEYDNDQIKY
jgi:hypothetical protein